MVRLIRTVYSSFRMAMLLWFADPQWVIPNIIAPFIFTIAALILSRTVSGSYTWYAILGGAMMGMWGNTLYASGFAIEAERWWGTIEYTFATPSSLLHIIGGRSISNALMGLTNMLAILAIALIGFQTPLAVANFPGFILALVITILSVSALGLIFASAFVLTRQASVLTNGLELPLYIVSGSMFPIALLPFWTHPVALSLAPTWGIEAMRYASSQVQLGLTFWSDLGVMTLMSVAYVFIATILFRKVETRARMQGTMALV